LAIAPWRERALWAELVRREFTVVVLIEGGEGPGGVCNLICGDDAVHIDIKSGDHGRRWACSRWRPLGGVRGRATVAIGPGRTEFVDGDLSVVVVVEYDEGICGAGDFIG